MPITRERSDLLYETLRYIILNPNCKQTQIMSKVNVTHKMITEMLNHLFKINQIVIINKQFRITEVGLSRYVAYRIGYFLDKGKGDE